MVAKTWRGRENQRKTHEVICFLLLFFFLSLFFFAFDEGKKNERIFCSLLVVSFSFFLLYKQERFSPFFSSKPSQAWCVRSKFAISRCSLQSSPLLSEDGDTSRSGSSLESGEQRMRENETKESHHIDLSLLVALFLSRSPVVSSERLPLLIDRTRGFPRRSLRAYVRAQKRVDERARIRNSEDASCD